MEQLIPVINKLQDLVSTIHVPLEINLPQIVVVGSQSAGKSSVLESIVGRDFLPRGTGIVTRRPLILQLRKHDVEFAEFSHTGGKRYTDYNEVRQEIVNVTEREASRLQVSSNPINLKIYSPTVLDITLVDLPGLVVNPLPGQPQNIAEQVRKLLLSYIRNESSLILAVTPANVDIATSEAIKIAQEVDREGQRTLAVLTKLDLMDRGTDAADVLLGRVIPMKLGYIGVLCRSQEDINKNLTFDAHLINEQEFFANHTTYKSYLDLLGTIQLRCRLNELLIEHIKNSLPALRSRIEKLHLIRSNELARYGSPLEDFNKAKTMLFLVQKYCAVIKDRLEGRGYDMEVNRLQGAANINKVLFSDFPTEMKRSAGPASTKLDNAIINASGFSGTIFIPENLFEKILSESIRLLEPVCINCVDLVASELRKLSQVTFNELDNIPQLRQEIQTEFCSLVKLYAGKTKKLVKSLVKIESEFININHPDFHYGSIILETILPLYSSKSNPQALEGFIKRFSPSTVQELHLKLSEENATSFSRLFSTNEKKTVVTQLIKKLTGNYYSIVLKNLCDSVVKAVASSLLKRCKDNIATELINRIYTPENVETFMVENPEISRRRKECLRVIEYTTKAKLALGEIDLTE
mmetsp:Transcript_31898/g.54945  ORF Transcript_31898/g.54945 Transcript_31898/m.54945 type:complete len:637 (-) Transcript_31898:25-1935(-)